MAPTNTVEENTFYTRLRRRFARLSCGWDPGASEKQVLQELLLLSPIISCLHVVIMFKFAAGQLPMVLSWLPANVCLFCLGGACLLHAFQIKTIDSLRNFQWLSLLAEAVSIVFMLSIGITLAWTTNPSLSYQGISAGLCIASLLRLSRRPIVIGFTACALVVFSFWVLVGPLPSDDRRDFDWEYLPNALLALVVSIGAHARHQSCEKKETGLDLRRRFELKFAHVVPKPAWEDPPGLDVGPDLDQEKTVASISTRESNGCGETVSDNSASLRPSGVFNAWRRHNSDPIFGHVPYSIARRNVNDGSPCSDVALANGSCGPHGVPGVEVHQIHTDAPSARKDTFVSSQHDSTHAVEPFVVVGRQSTFGTDSSLMAFPGFGRQHTFGSPIERNSGRIPTSISQIPIWDSQGSLGAVVALEGDENNEEVGELVPAYSPRIGHTSSFHELTSMNKELFDVQTAKWQSAQQEVMQEVVDNFEQGLSDITSMTKVSRATCAPTLLLPQVDAVRAMQGGWEVLPGQRMPDIWLRSFLILSRLWVSCDGTEEWLGLSTETGQPMIAGGTIELVDGKLLRRGRSGQVLRFGRINPPNSDLLDQIQGTWTVVKRSLSAESWMDSLVIDGVIWSGSRDRACGLLKRSSSFHPGVSADLTNRSVTLSLVSTETLCLHKDDKKIADFIRVNREK